MAILGRLQLRRIPPAAFLLHRRWRLNPRSARRGNQSFMVSPSPDEATEWWAVDGEMHEVGEGVPVRERFAIPRDNLPIRRRKQMREQYMRRTRLTLKDNEHEFWCKSYIELYQELRENWERLYWDEGYSKKIAQDHANYDSAEDDDLDFSPYRRRRATVEQPEDNAWERVNRIRDKFEYDRDRRMRERAFGPMDQSNQPFDARRGPTDNTGNAPFHERRGPPNLWNQPFDPNSRSTNTAGNEPFHARRGSIGMEDEPFDAQRFNPLLKFMGKSNDK